MKTIKNNIGNEIIIFAETLENEAFEQIKKLANHEAYQYQKIRMMPDAHAGKGCTIGTTMTIGDKITPNLVGVDIGCGMLTIQTLEKDIDFEKLDNLIKSEIPSGNDVHKYPTIKFDFSKLHCKSHVDISRAALSIGTLGGGNHFIEVGKDSNGFLYLIIHSGSRKLGVDICKYYQDIAIKSVTSNSGAIKETRAH